MLLKSAHSVTICTWFCLLLSSSSFWNRTFIHTEFKAGFWWRMQSRLVIWIILLTHITILLTISSSSFSSRKLRPRYGRYSQRVRSWLVVDGGEHALDAFVVSRDGRLEGAVGVQLVLDNLVKVVQLGSQRLQQRLGGARREDSV